MSDITTEALAAELRKMSDNAYCAYIEQMRRDLCLGSEYKLKHGKFGQDNLDAFMRAAEWLGRHKAMHEASVLVSQRTEQNPWRQAVDEALIAHALDCTGPGDDPKEKVKELIEWAVTIATDPRVSERAVLALQPSASAEPKGMRAILISYHSNNLSEDEAVKLIAALPADQKEAPIQVLSKYWKITRIDQDRLRVEADGVASATVSVMSYEPLEMLLASMAEELLASPVTAAREQEGQVPFEKAVGSEAGGTGARSSEWGRLYTTANAVVARIGCDGQIDSRADEVASLMDALHDLDGGQWMPGLMPATPTTSTTGKDLTDGAVFHLASRIANLINRHDGKAETLMPELRALVQDVIAVTGKVDASRVRDEALEWKDVRVHGLPACDGETVFVGENEAGFMGCFNAYSDEAFWMDTPEYTYNVMSGLRFWRVQDRPTIGTPKSAEGEGA